MAKRHYVVVVADDDPAIVRILYDLLQDEGYRALCCFSGKEALRVIRRVKPDLAIVDLQMEARDAGFQVLEQLHRHPETARVSVVICSADGALLEARRQEILACGGEILTKPFDIPTLLGTIDRLVNAAP